MAAPDLTVFDRIKTKADFDRENEMFQLKRLALQQAKSGNLPAALQIADRITQLRTSQDPTAQQQIQDIQMAQKMLRVDPGVYMNQGLPMELPGYGDVVGGIEGEKAYGKQEAQNYSDRTWKPGTAAAVTAAELGQVGPIPLTPQEKAQREASGKAAGELEGSRNAEMAGNEKVLPIIEELKAFNEQSPSYAYANIQQPIRKLYPGTSPQESAVDLMNQARIELAAPLAKQLGVNPTDRDFQASLDRIFDISASKESRGLQIKALENRIKNRQEQLTGTIFQPPELDPRNIPMEAVRELKADPSGAAEFDEIFGQGAARMVLDGK